MATLNQAQIIAIHDKIKNIQSKRARIMEGLRLILETITTVNGYTENVCEVTYEVKGWKDKSEDQTPVLYIIDDATTITRHAGCVREYVWQIRIYGVYRQGDILKLEEFISDVEQCVYDNNTLASEVNKCEVTQITTDNQLFSVQNQTHLFEMIVSAEYTRKARSSR